MFAKALGQLEMLDPGEKEWADGLKHAGALYDLALAIEKDVELAGRGEFVRLHSNTLEEIGKIGLSYAPRFYRWIKNNPKLPKAVPTLGALEFLTAASRHIGAGTADIDTRTHYIDGVNRFAWGVLGLYACKLQLECAAGLEMFGGTLARVSRERLEPLFVKWELKKMGQAMALADAWRAAQERRIHDGLSVLSIRDLYGEDILVKNGFTREQIALLDEEAAWLSATRSDAYDDLRFADLVRLRSGGIQLAGILFNPSSACADGSQPPCGRFAFDWDHFKKSKESDKRYHERNVHLSLADDGHVGGVLLHGAATIPTATGDSLRGGDFSLVFASPRNALDIRALRRFVTALWAVYFGGDDGPGVSIDPIAPGVDKHLVRYIGHVINSDLARVMRETDYTMKRWAVGTESPGIDGFLSVDQLSASHGIKRLGADRRFWFVPHEMSFERTDEALLFRSGRMTLQTEYLFLNTGSKAEPADEQFAAYFTENYFRIAERHPSYLELFEYAKLVSLARFLKERSVPLLWFLLANKDLVLTEDSPGTVDALAKKSDVYDYIRIEGGVDFSPQSHTARYVLDPKAATAIAQAFRLGTTPTSTVGTTTTPVAITTASTPTATTSVRRQYAVTASQNVMPLPSGSARFDTDIAIRESGQPGLELVRYYDPSTSLRSPFGGGWHLMMLYRVLPADEKRITFRNAVIPDQMTVRNIVTGRDETLTFSETRYSIVGYVPADLTTSSLIGLFLLSDGSMRLADKLGNEYQFDPAGRMTEVAISDSHRTIYEYGRQEASRDAYESAPYRLEPIGDERELVLNAVLPRRLRLVDGSDAVQQVFVLNLNTASKLVGYTPESAREDGVFLSLLSDGSFVLDRNNGETIAFFPDGSFSRRTVEVITGIRQSTHQVKLDYEFALGEFRIREARVLQEGLTATLYTVKYGYGEDGRLARVTTPTGETIQISQRDAGPGQQAILR